MTTTDNTTLGAESPLIPGMGEEGEKLTVTQATAAPARRATQGVDSRGSRPVSRELSAFPVLTGREEDWRFTPLKRLQGLHLPDGDEGRLTGAAPSVTVSELEGVRVETVSRDDSRLGTVHTPEDRVSAAAWNSFSEATVVTVSGEVSAPVRIDVVGTGTEAAASHLKVVVEANCRADVVITHKGSAVLAQNVEFELARDAALNVTSIQAWDAGSVHVSSQQASVDTGAHFKHVAVTYGGDLVRLTPTARFADERGEAELYGLYYADAGQHLEQRLFVDHNRPNCVSNVLYKGALQGQDAHTVWVGDVLIRAEAEGTDTYEKNQNLLLTDGARADSVPNLEIETGVIEGAGHASATGRFDETQLFYLMARGIGEDEARKLIVRGFLNEIIQKVGVADVEQELTDVMEAELKIASL
ncbi:Fe-S cluster assembly protein SufD [Micrococcus lylae]|uniref:Fe-S cluster assembly protein SufD n=1 Tax=Micrococcus lylae TaxID=1273 RepID=A0ABY2K1D9_9MICC|nr:MULTISPECIES: Fe-S cluster assembly protein SufD [Micrococcus]OFR86205.1 Fe-S cluster assembly protein SufD [Micrococcus sp. HMSC067E09]TFI00815.1 Fe-S cluster assembly protein SufD [Micrococcus lylae]